MNLFGPHSVFKNLSDVPKFKNKEISHQDADSSYMWQKIFILLLGLLSVTLIIPGCSSGACLCWWSLHPQPPHLSAWSCLAQGGKGDPALFKYVGLRKPFLGGGGNQIFIKCFMWTWGFVCLNAFGLAMNCFPVVRQGCWWHRASGNNEGHGLPWIIITVQEESPATSCFLGGVALAHFVDGDVGALGVMHTLQDHTCRWQSWDLGPCWPNVSVWLPQPPY